MTTPGGLKILDDTSDKDGQEGVTNIVYKEVFKDLRVTQVCRLLTLNLFMFIHKLMNT